MCHDLTSRARNPEFTRVWMGEGGVHTCGTERHPDLCSGERPAWNTGAPHRTERHHMCAPPVKKNAVASMLLVTRPLEGLQPCSGGVWEQQPQAARAHQHAAAHVTVHSAAFG